MQGRQLTTAEIIEEQVRNELKQEHHHEAVAAERPRRVHANIVSLVA